MHRHTRSETGAGELSSPRSSRAASFSSDRPSVAGSVTFQMPSSVRPAPAYIAASVASEVVTEHINKQLNNDSSADALENALFSEQALRLLNAFLDHLLFAFLSSARSPSLTAIRPAITDVLKPRLAREAFVTADDELQGLLAGDDDEEFPSAEHGNTPGRWDVEKVWKRTRLRIMVYTRLGELEDDDEERYVQQEKGLSMDESDDDEANLVSWASAIFLTSVVEYIAEQSLVVSGQAAYARTSAKMKKHAQPTADGEEQQLERIVVEDFDVEKIALNAGLGRLWRTWRKRVRSPITPISPTRGPRYMTSFSSLHRRRVSHDTNGDESIISNDMREVSEYEPTETEIAANIPLPMTENDVAEIEVPGLARQPDDESSGTETPVPRPQRPSSFIMLAPADGFRKHVLRERPVSMPPPASGEFIVSPRFESPQDESPQDESPQAESELESPQAESELESPQAESELESPQVESSPAEHPTPARTEGEVFETPMERMSDDDSYIHDERQEDIPQEQTASPEQVVIPEQKAAPERKVTPHVPRVTVPDTEQDSDNDPDMVAFAASTGMGFGMSPITPTKSTDLDKEGEDTIETPTQTGYDKEPQVFESKRMSIEKSKPPSIVRTFSTRSNRSSGHVPTPEGRPTPEGNSYLDDAPSDEDVSGPEAIGIAHTSNRAIPATPSPPAESASRPPSIVRAPERNSTDHVSPRHFATPTTVARKTPSPEEKPQPERPAPHKDISPLSPPKTRGAALPALQESEVVAPKRHTSEALQPGSSRQSPKQGSSRFREAQPTAAAITTARRSVESSPRSKNAARDSFPVEKSTLKRVSSSSSTNKSVGTSILHSGRDSDVSIGRPRGLSGRMSEEDREREFDSLVKSPETVKYTLTPQSMRDLDVSVPCDGPCLQPD
ncbi:hypothetical protein EJ04DRAFT_217973 [Polyplosphaeria fusca]|uniref:Uncharacterized protein n=1 Tax=Polyplosphaeria fusca TaxID=682080 RepID=A0A9P4V4G6_9PLEO|nr:hypothetical protein EJ04DRAFT_217973 [Polyplosphaeria fusca]